MIEVVTLDNNAILNRSCIPQFREREREAYVRMCVAALFIIARNWKHPDEHCIPQLQNSYSFQIVKWYMFGYYISIIAKLYLIILSIWWGRLWYLIVVSQEMRLRGRLASFRKAAGRDEQWTSLTMKVDSERLFNHKTQVLRTPELSIRLSTGSRKSVSWI